MLKKHATGEKWGGCNEYEQIKDNNASNAVNYVMNYVTVFAWNAKCFAIACFLHLLVLVPVVSGTSERYSWF